MTQQPEGCRRFCLLISFILTLFTQIKPCAKQICSCRTSSSKNLYSPSHRFARYILLKRASALKFLDSFIQGNLSQGPVVGLAGSYERIKYLSNAPHFVISAEVISLRLWYFEKPFDLFPSSYVGNLPSSYVGKPWDHPLRISSIQVSKRDGFEHAPAYNTGNPSFQLGLTCCFPRHPVFFRGFLGHSSLGIGVYPPTLPRSSKAQRGKNVEKGLHMGVECGFGPGLQRNYVARVVGIFHEAPFLCC